MSTSAQPTPEQEQRAKWDLLLTDLELRRKQAWWEHPRNAAIILGVFTALVGAFAGVTGYQLAKRPPQTIVVQLQQPIAVRTAP